MSEGLVNICELRMTSAYLFKLFQVVQRGLIHQVIHTVNQNIPRSIFHAPNESHKKTSYSRD